jgi:2,5-diamino-6-(ribosylamino)-4(3H)-pyrimidinone 5'-phosphate reductase
MKPKVICYMAVSEDGRSTGFDIDLGQYYGLVSTWHEDATLSGSGTILHSGTPQDKESDKKQPQDKNKPLLVITDSKGLVKCWMNLINAGFWRGGLSVCTEETPKEHLDYLKSKDIGYIICGKEQVDMKKLMDILADKYGVKIVRTDSGGKLNEALLDEGLVEELSLLVHPVSVGEKGRSAFEHFDYNKLKPFFSKDVGNGVIWRRYEIKRKGQ